MENFMANLNSPYLEAKIFFVQVTLFLYTKTKTL